MTYLIDRLLYLCYLLSLSPITQNRFPSQEGKGKGQARHYGYHRSDPFKEKSGHLKMAQSATGPGDLVSHSLETAVGKVTGGRDSGKGTQAFLPEARAGMISGVITHL